MYKKIRSVFKENTYLFLCVKKKTRSEKFRLVLIFLIKKSLLISRVLRLK